MRNNSILNKNYNGKLINEMFRMLLPAQILSTATASLSAVINGILIGNFLSDASLVALGFVTPLVSILGALASIISGGSRVLCGRFMGQSEIKKLDYVFTGAMFCAVGLGAVLTLLAQVFANPLAYILGARGSFIAETAIYIRGLSLGFIPSLVIPTLMVLLQMRNESTYSLVSAVVLAAGNLLFSLANIKFFGASLIGMGFATSLAQYITVGFLVIKFITNKSLMRFDMHCFDKLIAKEMVVLGSPTALAAALYATRNIVLNTLALKVGGDVAVSALAIVMSLTAPLDSLSIGVGAVCLILSSVFVGEKDEEAMQDVFKSTIKYGWILAAGQLIVAAILGRPIASLFGATGIVLNEAYLVFLIFSMNKPFNIITLAIVNPAQSMGKIKLINFFYLFNALILPLSYTLITLNILGPIAVYSTYATAEVLGLILIAIYARSTYGHFPKNISEILMLDKEVFLGNKLTVSIKNMDEVINVSKTIIDFCKENGIDERRSMLAGLCLEEMAGNVVEHGFTKGKKRDYTIDLFASVQDDDLMLRIRNNTVQFDPVKAYSPFNPEDPMKNIGIRMVNKLAKEMNYQSSFGMNVLSIKL